MSAGALVSSEAQLGKDLLPSSQGCWPHSDSPGLSRLRALVSVEYWFDMILNLFVYDLGEGVLILFMQRQDKVLEGKLFCPTTGVVSG